MKKISNTCFTLSMFLIAIGIFLNREMIVKTIVQTLLEREEVSFEYKNSYFLQYKFDYINNMDKFKLENKDDLMDLYYSVINNGSDTFDFYCPDDYKKCLNDVTAIAYDSQVLSTINGFVHPYNSFDTVETYYYSSGRVSLKINKTYSTEKINSLNTKVEEIVKNEVKNEKDEKKIIKIIHDYIVGHTKYDSDRTDNNVINYESNTAYGVLYQGYGICSGYADAMAIFLNYYGIPNYKVSSENHVWNAVLLTNEKGEKQWYHLDLTWDDPITSNGQDIIDDTYFLKTTEELKKLKDNQHNFDYKIYSELAI